MTRTHNRLAAVGALLALGAVSCDDAVEEPGQPAESRPALSGRGEPATCAALGEGRLDVELLALHDEAEIERAVSGCLAVSEEEARLFALGYAALEMGLQGPLAVRLVLPVEDSRGTLLARQVIVSSVVGEEGYGPLAADVAPLLDGLEQSGDRSFFVRAHEATAAAFATIDVAARFFRHPLRWAHRGIPRWLAEAGEAPRSACGEGLVPRAILPAAGIRGAGRIVRYECDDGGTLLFSHYADRSYARGEVRTLHEPLAVFRRWSSRVSTGYDDPAARLRFVEGLWARYVSEGRRP